MMSGVLDLKMKSFGYLKNNNKKEIIDVTRTSLLKYGS